MGMILRIASSRIVGQGDIVGRSGYFSLNLSANSVMRGRLDARRTLKSLVADLRMKINMIHSTGQAFSTSGALRYQASDRVAFKVFGSYAIGNTYGMDTHRYGATMSLDMSERFGMEVGVQRYYDAYRGRWETVPVVIPYYNFDKFKLSLDVGGILYEILRNTVFDNRGGSGGATIAPPRFQMPPLR